MPSGLVTTLIVLLSAGLTDTAQDVPADQAISKYNDLRSRPVQTMTNVEVAAYLEGRTATLRDSKLPFVPSREMGELGLRTRGQAYRLNAWRFDMAESDCVTFVERTLALSLAVDWKSYRVLCDRLRHKDGKVGFRERNFHTLGDWVPNNAWLLDDVSDRLGREKQAPREFTHVVRPKVFQDIPIPGSKYVRTVFKGSDYKSGAAEIRKEFYIPLARLDDVLSELQTGDIILMLRASAGGHLGCDHLGMVINDGDPLSILHARPPQVTREPVREFFRKHPIQGIKVLRLREDAQRAALAELGSSLESDDIADGAAEDKRVELLRRKRSSAVRDTSDTPK